MCIYLLLGLCLSGPWKGRKKTRALCFTDAFASKKPKLLFQGGPFHYAFLSPKLVPEICCRFYICLIPNIIVLKSNPHGPISKKGKRIYLSACFYNKETLSLSLILRKMCFFFRKLCFQLLSDLLFDLLSHATSCA